MNRAVRVVAILFLALTALGIPLGALAQDTEQNAPQRYIVTFASNVPSAGSLAALLANSDGFRVTHSYDNVFKGFSAELSPMQVQWLRAFSSVTSIQPDSVAHVTDQTTPTGIQRIGDLLNGTANIGGGSSVNISVATLDTGIDINNSDLNVGGGFNAINASTCTGSASNGSYQDDNGHGTHVAGTIAAKDNGSGVVGVAPGAKVYAVKVFDSSGNGYVSSIICGINWIVSNATTDNIKVVNFSGAWGGSNSANCGNSRSFFSWKQTRRIRRSAAWSTPRESRSWWPRGMTARTPATRFLPPIRRRSPSAPLPTQMASQAVSDRTRRGAPTTLGPPSATMARLLLFTRPAWTSSPTGLEADWRGRAGPAWQRHTSPAPWRSICSTIQDPSPATVTNALVSNGEAGSWGSPYGSQPLLNVGNAAFGPVAPPTPLHNVVVSSITPSSPVIDTVANNVTVHISNTGNQSESGLQVILTDQTTSATIGTQNVSSALSAGAGTDVSFSWTPSGSGSHTLKAEVKNGNTDNTLTQGVTVSAVSHNITVTSVNVVTQPAFTNTANSVSAHITNAGNVAESITVSLSDDNSSNNGAPQVINLNPNASQNVTISWTPTGNGTHNLTVTAAITGHNYTGGTSISVGTQVHDVHVTNVSVPGNVTQGQSATVSVAVQNDGSFSETFSLGFPVRRQALLVSLVAQNVTLGPGGSTTVNFTWNTTTSTVAQSYSVTATATLGNSETDATPGNNSATSGTITVQQKPANQNIWVTGLTATNPQSHYIKGLFRSEAALVLLPVRRCR